MRHEYLLALHTSGSAVAETGWVNQLLCLQRGGQLLGACALYLKSHSYGEYVFDWAWADAYQRHGLHYYPKLLCAAPFTPVPGSRLLARDVMSSIDLPGFARSTMDGYAVRAVDTFGTSDALPALLTIAGEVCMGEEARMDLPRHSCVRVATGAMLPAWADAVVMVELEEGPMVFGSMPGIDVDTIEIGMPVEVYFVAAAEDTGVPYWRPVR